MFYERVLLRASQGKGDELRALLQDRTTSSQPRLRTLLVESVLGKGQTFVSGTFHDTLQAYDTEREARRADSGFRSFAAKVSSLLSHPREVQLYEIISSAGAGGGSARFTHVVELIAARDKEMEVREALENFAQARQAEGARQPSLYRRLFPTQGPTFLIIGAYQDLSEHETTTLSPREHSQLDCEDKPHHRGGTATAVIPSDSAELQLANTAVRPAASSQRAHGGGLG